MSKRRANTESEAKAWKTAEERSKEKCTWLTKKERDENLAALKRMEDLMLCLNIKNGNNRFVEVCGVPITRNDN